MNQQDKHEATVYEVGIPLVGMTYDDMAHALILGLWCKKHVGLPYIHHICHALSMCLWTPRASAGFCGEGSRRETAVSYRSICRKTTTNINKQQLVTAGCGAWTSLEFLRQKSQKSQEKPRCQADEATHSLINPTQT